MDPVRAIGETTATHTEKTVPGTKTVDTALDHDRPGETGATDIGRDLVSAGTGIETAITIDSNHSNSNSNSHNGHEGMVASRRGIETDGGMMT